MKIRNITDVIPTGEERAISMAALARALDITERDVRKAILQARMAGSIIAGTGSGYFIPDTDEELLTYYRIAKARGLTTLASLKATRRELKERGILPMENTQRRTTNAAFKDDYTTNMKGGGGK